MKSGHLAQLLRPTLLDFTRYHWAKSVPPKSDGFVRNVDAAFVKQILYVPERQREANVHHRREADGLR